MKNSRREQNNKTIYAIHSHPTEFSTDEDTHQHNNLTLEEAAERPTQYVKGEKLFAFIETTINRRRERKREKLKIPLWPDEKFPLNELIWLNYPPPLTDGISWHKHAAHSGAFNWSNTECVRTTQISAGRPWQTMRILPRWRRLPRERGTRKAAPNVQVVFVVLWIEWVLDRIWFDCAILFQPLAFGEKRVNDCPFFPTTLLLSLSLVHPTS